MANINLDRESLLAELKSKIICVVFEKKDGSLREMKCTRNLELAPEAPVPQDPNSDTNTDIIRVYDVEAEGWRSFIVDNVKSASHI